MCDVYKQTVWSWHYTVWGQSEVSYCEVLRGKDSIGLSERCVYNSKVWESLSSWTPDFDHWLCTEQRWLHCRPRCCVMTSVWTSHTVGFINPRATEGRPWLKIENSWNLGLAVSRLQTLPPNLRVSRDERATNKWTEANSFYLLYPHWWRVSGEQVLQVKERLLCLCLCDTEV